MRRCGPAEDSRQPVRLDRRGPTLHGGTMASRNADTSAVRRAAELATAFLETVDDRAVGAAADAAVLRAAIDRPLPGRGEDPVAVIEALASEADPGIVAMAGPRYFGFVIGGHHPAALAADWLT